MLCDNCKKNIATTHIKKVVNNVVTEKHLCSHCAAEGGYLSGNSFVDMLASVFGETLMLNPASSVEKCSCCGSTFSDIVESGKAGCSECYKTFKDEFEQSLYRIHGKSTHIGKKPNEPYSATVSFNKTTKNKTVGDLKLELNEAISSENFEKAAELRDKIKELEGSVNNE